MSIKSLRTTVAAAMGGAVLVAGLLVGASLAFAQDVEDSDGADDTAVTDSLDRVNGLLERLMADPDTLGEGELGEIIADLQADIEPLVEEIREKALDAVDSAVDAGILSEDEAAAVKERIEAFELPGSFPFGHRGPLFRFGPGEFDGDFDCFRFRIGPDGVESSEDCPDLELPEGFPFGDHDFRFGPLPDDFEFDGEKFRLFGDELRGFIEEFDFDFEGLQELLESGLTLEEALEEMGVDLEQTLDRARDDALARIDDLVADGTLSEEQAERIKEMLEGIDFSGGFPFGLRHFEFDFDDFDPERFFPEGFDLDDLRFEFDGFGPHGPRFFGDHDFFWHWESGDEADAEGAMLDA
ncbi:MAG: hypothetical protein QNJ77_07435 [Acidimicrobiia bacterium]|nr:hypothetical protein [Acidimicrobiia bacterium]